MSGLRIIKLNSTNARFAGQHANQQEDNKHRQAQAGRQFAREDAGEKKQSGNENFKIYSEHKTTLTEHDFILRKNSVQAQFCRRTVDTQGCVVKAKES